MVSAASTIGTTAPGAERRRPERRQARRWRYNRDPIHRRDPTMSAAMPQSQPANTERQYQVSRKDLPLSCPMPSMELWNSHPRVYLPIEASGTATCPYCGARYELID